MKRKIKYIIISFCFCFILLAAFFIYKISVLPDEAATDKDNIIFGDLFTADFIISDSVPVISADGKEASVCTSKIKLFDTIPVKDISITKKPRRYVLAGGELVGIRLNTDGVVVVGTEDFYSGGKKTDPAKTAGIETGDIIISVNGTKITSNKELSDMISESDGKELELEIYRNETKKNVVLQPEISDITKKYKGGLWIRDCMSGIGTMTYKDPETGTIATLGHGIYDTDTKKIIPAGSGDILNADLAGIKKGKSGAAGEVRGIIGNEKCGALLLNCNAGIYGHITSFTDASDLIPVAFASEVKTGKAEIISSLDGNTKKHFDIEIEKLNYSDKDSGKNMVIKITDNDLINLTGGIIQGMSGSPIIQDGRLIGAVTHVFLNDPLHGYGIFAENMLNVSDSLAVNNAA